MLSSETSREPVEGLLLVLAQVFLGLAVSLVAATEAFEGAFVA